MRTRVLAALAGLSLAAAPVLAQQHRIGFHGGLNFATVSGSGADDIMNKSSRTGIMFGGFAEIGLGRQVALAPEVNYSQRGVKGRDGSDEAVFKVNYVEVPLLLKIVLPMENSTIRPHFYGGPMVSFRSTCNVALTSGAVTVDVDCNDPDIDADLNSTDFGVLLGGGVDVGPVFFGLRYNLGLRNVSNDPPPNNEVRHRVFSALVGVSFPVGH